MKIKEQRGGVDLYTGTFKFHGDDGSRIRTGMHATTNEFRMDAERDEEHWITGYATAGQRFDEVEEKYGDYIMMAPDGNVTVFDKDDNVIGSVKVTTKQDVEEQMKR